MGENFGLFKSFGDRLFEGETPTNLGLIGNISLLDVDTSAFITRVTAAGGTLNLTEITAVNNLVLQLKIDNIWTSMKAVYPMVGSSAAACAQNLISDTYTGSFTSGWTFASTGVTGNGTSSYMNTSLIPSSVLSLNSAHLSVYLRTVLTPNQIFLGSKSTPPNDLIYLLNYGFLAVNNGDTVATNTAGQNGFFVNSRTASNSVKQYKNNAILTALTTASTGLSVASIYVGAFNNGGTVLLPSNNQISFASIGDGLNDTQESNFYTAVQAFQTTLGRQITSNDVDAQAFFDRVTAAGGTLTSTEQTAVNNLVIDMKATGTWTGMKAIYPMVGSSAAACSQNLKSSSFTGSFSSGWTFASTGVTPNGSSAFMNTAFTPNGNLSVNSQSYGYYSRSNTAAGAKREMGGYSPLLGGNEDVGLLAKYTGDLFYSIIGGTIYPNVANTDSRGLFIINRTSATNVKGYKNNSLVINGTNPNVTILNMPVYIGCRNTNTVPGEFTDRQCAFSFIGDALTDTQASDLYNSVQTFQTTLSRQV